MKLLVVWAIITCAICLLGKWLNNKMLMYISVVMMFLMTAIA